MGIIHGWAIRYGNFDIKQKMVYILITERLLRKYCSGIY